MYGILGVSLLKGRLGYCNVKEYYQISKIKVIFKIHYFFYLFYFSA